MPGARLAAARGEARRHGPCGDAIRLIASASGAAAGNGSSAVRRRRRWRTTGYAPRVWKQQGTLEDLQSGHGRYRQLPWGGGQEQHRDAPSLQLEEAEVSLQAIVDPYARADFFLAASPEGLEIEEGFLTLTSLPGGLLAKVGKMKEQFGKVNTMHAHMLPWVDAPLVMKNLMGGDEGINDSGISVSKLILNPFFFLEATGELYQGNSGVFQRTSAAT